MKDSGLVLSVKVDDRRRQVSEKPWTIPRTSYPHFTGRQRVRELLASVLNPAKSLTPPCQRCFVISGLGGTGKSEVCIKFAEEHRDEYVESLFERGQSLG